MPLSYHININDKLVILIVIYRPIRNQENITVLMSTG